MRKKFRTKKHVKLKSKYIPYLIVIFIVLVFLITLSYISNLKIRSRIVSLLSSSNVYDFDFSYEKKRLVTLLTGIDMSEPINIFESVSNYQDNHDLIFNFSKNELNLTDVGPLVYIYNTHQTEEYIGSDMIPTPTVLTGAYYLENLLENMGVNTLVEENNISKILEDNNWSYVNSYKASRINLECVKNEYPSIKIFIDFHRDAVNRNISTVTIGDKDYAKVLFVIGKEHDNYLSNLDFTNRFNELIGNRFPTLTKGILQKAGPGVNGIYNQDVGDNVILMEVGGNENTIDEVTNTLDLIAPLIKEYINEY